MATEFSERLTEFVIQAVLKAIFTELDKIGAWGNNDELTNAQIGLFQSLLKRIEKFPKNLKDLSDKDVRTQFGETIGCYYGRLEALRIAANTAINGSYAISALATLSNGIRTFSIEKGWNNPPSYFPPAQEKPAGPKTVFFKATQKLITTKLTGLLCLPENRNNRSTRELLLALQRKIINLSPAETDEKSIELIKRCLVETQGKVAQYLPQTLSQTTPSPTMTDLNSLMVNLGQYLQDVRRQQEIPKLKLKFLDNPHDKQSPLSLLYFYTLYYLGEERLNPSEKIDHELRATKEAALLSQLNAAQLGIRPDMPLSDQITIITNTIGNIQRDNQQATEDKRFTANLPLFSFVGFSATLPVRFFGPSPGRLKDCMNDAQVKVTRLEEFKPSSP